MIKNFCEMILEKLSTGKVDILELREIFLKYKDAGMEKDNMHLEFWILSNMVEH